MEMHVGQRVLATASTRGLKVDHEYTVISTAVRCSLFYAKQIDYRLRSSDGEELVVDNAAVLLPEVE